MKELHLLKVEEVELLFFFFPQSKQVVFSFGLTFGQRHKFKKIKKKNHEIWTQRIRSVVKFIIYLEPFTC